MTIRQPRFKIVNSRWHANQGRYVAHFPPNSRRLVQDGIKQVLLVNDNQDDIALTRRAMARAGFAVHLQAMQNVDAILQHIELTDPEMGIADLILVDLDMRQLDGYALIGQIRQLQHNSHRPIVAVSNADDEQRVIRCYRSGASSYVHKSDDFTIYAQTLQQVCAYWLTLNRVPVPNSRRLTA